MIKSRTFKGLIKTTLALGVILAFLFAGVTPALAATYSGGSGTEGDPYRISTADDWTTLMNTSADWDKYFILTADIDLGEASLTPVGNSGTNFTGTFDGNNHVLSNATINREMEYSVGVFGYVGSDGRIIDLGVEDINVTAESYVGGLAGYNKGTITDSYATGAVTSSGGFEGGWEVGGLVGYNYQGTITDSYATGAVTSSGGFDGGWEVGGLVGSSYQGTITRCYATGSVTVTDEYHGGYEVGGLAGRVYQGTISDSYATGSVTGHYNVGGLAGSVSSATITNCYATGAVSGDYAGGLVASASSCTVTTSYWDTQTTGQSSSAAGTGRTTDEMTYPHDADTYVDWDFTDTWAADIGNDNNGYPLLHFQSISSAPEMTVEGNSTEITSGDSTPSTADHTDYGSADIDSGSVTRTFTIRNTGTADLTLSGDPKVAIGGSHAADFTVTTQPSGTVSASGSTTFQVTFNPSSTGVRTATISIANDDSDENPYTFAIQGIGTKVLTVSGITASNKVYDGNTTATLNTDSAALVGVVEGDFVSLNTGSAAGAFANKNVGTGKTVTVSGLTLSGDDASYYSVTQPTTAANITAKTLTVTATGVNRVYDGTTTATVTLSDDRVEGDTLTASFTGAAFGDKNVGAGKVVSVSGISISGDDAANYSLAGTTAETTADIALRSITVTAVTDSKTYDGTTSSSGTPTITSGSLASSDSVAWTQTFDNKNVGTDKTLTPAGTVSDGNSGNNYSVTYTPVSTGTITVKALTVSGITADNKVYSGNTTATLNTDSAALVGVVGSDNVTLNTGSASGTFADKNVGTAKTVTISGLALSGDDAGNYSLTQPAATADITARPITVTAATDTKEYDGTTSSSGTPTITSGSLASGDSVTWTQTFDNENVGTSKTITPAGTVSDGNSGNNYSVTYATVTTGTITARAITVTAATDSKEYNGTTSSSGTPTITSGSLADGDNVTWTQTFDNKNVGTNKTLTPAGTVSDGNSGNNYSVTYATVTTGTITAKAVTVTAATDTKEYDGTTNSSETPTITSGSLDSGDNVTWTQTFDNKNVGTNKTLTPAGTVSDGNSGNNYSVTYTTVSTGSITAKALTVSGVTADNKVYDGTTTATLNTGSADLVGAIGSDNVTLATGSATGAFSDKNVGTGKTVTISGLALSGDDAGNYSFTQPATTANITAKALTVSGIAANNKAYDGTSNATLNTGNAALVGAIEGDSVTLNKDSATGAFADNNVGTGKTVTVSGLTLGGDDAGNYSLTQPTTTADITAKTLTVTATGVNKVYDGATTATVTLSDDCIEGDTITTSYTGAAFEDKNVGTGKTVNISGISISGDDAANYSLAGITAATTADITVRSITVTAATDSKTYDGTTSSSGTPTTTSGSLVSGDNVTWTQTFDNKNVGTNKTLTPAGTVSDGNSGNNYSVTYTPVTNGTIMAKALTVNGITADDIVYSGNTTATLNTDNATLVGAVGSDNVTLNTGSATAVFADKNVGTGKTVTISELAISGDDVANYSLTQPTVTANITQKELTVTGITASNKVYDGNTTATLNTSSATLVGAITGDNVTLEVSSVTGTFADANVGTGKTVTISVLTLSGDDAGNYSLTQPTTTASITAPAGGGGGGDPEPAPSPTPTPTPTPVEEDDNARPIANIDTGTEPTALDTEGNSLSVTGSLITVSGEQTKLMVNIPVTLGEGAKLGSFTDAAGVTFKGNRLEIPAASATSGGKALLQIVDETGDLGTTIIIETGECIGTGDKAYAEVRAIKSSAGFTVKDFTSENPSLGEVASTVNLELATLPDGAQVKITTSLEPDSQADSAFQLAATNAGLGDISIAYTINVEKTNLQNGADIRSAAITMVVGKDWVEANGGTDAIRIIRYNPETSTQQVLETAFLGYDEQGRAVFEGISPDGLSVFGLIGKKAETIQEPAPQITQDEPKATPEPAQSGLEVVPAGNSDQTPEASSSKGWIIGLVIGIAAILAAAGFFIIRRRKQEKDISA